MAVTLKIKDAFYDASINALATGSHLEIVSITVYEAADASSSGTAHEYELPDSSVVIEKDLSNNSIKIKFSDSSNSSFFCKKIEVNIDDGVSQSVTIAELSGTGAAETVYYHSAGTVTPVAMDISLKASNPTTWSIADQSSLLSIPDATTAVKGITSFASDSEIAEGTADNKAVTPAGLHSYISDVLNINYIVQTATVEFDSNIVGTSLHLSEDLNIASPNSIVSIGGCLGRSVLKGIDIVRWVGLPNLYRVISSSSIEVVSKYRMAFKDGQLCFSPGYALNSDKGFSWTKISGGPWISSSAIGVATFSKGDGGFINESGYNVSDGTHSFSGGFYRTTVCGVCGSDPSTTSNADIMIGISYPADSGGTKSTAMLNGSCVDIEIFTGTAS